MPGAKYGLVSAAMVVFSYTVSDFGIPKVIGGRFDVLAVDIFKQVIGQQNFNKGAVVSLDAAAVPCWWRSPSTG
jgi:iron(III) transport system permease protein